MNGHVPRSPLEREFQRQILLSHCSDASGSPEENYLGKDLDMTHIQTPTGPQTYSSEPVR
jgi:hypothetical protein